MELIRRPHSANIGNISIIMGFALLLISFVAGELSAFLEVGCLALSFLSILQGLFMWKTQTPQLLITDEGITAESMMGVQVPWQAIKRYRRENVRVGHQVVFHLEVPEEATYMRQRHQLLRVMHYINMRRTRDLFYFTVPKKEADAIEAVLRDHNLGQA